MPTKAQLYRLWAMEFEFPFTRREDDPMYRKQFNEYQTTPMESKETTTSYTKGEWYLQKYTDAYTNIVRCNNGKGHDSLFIAATAQGSLPESRANARLMAAAPDLLESLQEIIAITDLDHIAWVKAKAAIDKAIGNQSTTTNDTTEGND